MSAPGAEASHRSRRILRTSSSIDIPYVDRTDEAAEDRDWAMAPPRDGRSDSARRRARSIAFAAPVVGRCFESRFFRKGMLCIRLNLYGVSRGKWVRKSR